MSARNVHYECVKVLIDAGADPRCTNANRDTALHFLLRASTEGSNNVPTKQQGLLSGTRSLNSRANGSTITGGASAKWLLAQKKKNERVFCDDASKIIHILKLLMKHGATPDPNIFGECPQHFICKLARCSCRESCAVKVLKAIIEFDPKEEQKKQVSLIRCVLAFLCSTYMVSVSPTIKVSSRSCVIYRHYHCQFF